MKKFLILCILQVINVFVAKANVQMRIQSGSPPPPKKKKRQIRQEKQRGVERGTKKSWKHGSFLVLSLLVGLLSQRRSLNLNFSFSSPLLLRAILQKDRNNNWCLQNRGYNPKAARFISLMERERRSSWRRPHPPEAGRQAGDSG